QRQGIYQPAEVKGAFGLNNTWRWRPFDQTYWYQSVAEVNSSYVPDTWNGSSIYYSLMMVFSAIQMAGPKLSPQAIEKGLSNFTAATDLPYSPRAGFAPGDYTFLKDWMPTWWDPSGTPPDASAGSGCLRLPDGGTRYTVESAFPADDRTANDANPPCNNDELNAAGGSQNGPPSQ
ncbi:MAG: hypothetical protein ACYDGR_14400, partial [Candidatus Dormibacteria bacterium]